MMRRFVLLIGVFLLVASGLSQAATTSRLTGTVVDNQGAALPGVTVSLGSDVLIGGTQVQITDANGAFQFNLLPPGQYQIRTDLPGFVPGEVEARVALDRATQVQIQMVMEQFADEIEVTAEAPVVDTTQVNTGESYNEEFLRKAAVSMGNRSYQSVIGNAAGATGGSNPNVLGSTATDNVYLVDGINTTDPITATFGTNFNYDAIQEVSIQTSGFEAEFGQALGGVVNLVTKSGGNNFSGALDLRYRDESFAESGDHFDPDVNINSRRDISVTLGGPILRDKVWFFVSGGQRFTETTPTNAPVTREFDGLDYLGKVTWQVSDAHRAVFKISGDPAEIPNANASQFVSPEAGRQQDQGGDMYAAELNSVLSDSWLLSLQVGIVRNYLDSYPVSGDFDRTGFYDLDNPGGALLLNNYINVQLSDRNSDQYKGSASYFVDDLVGPHELKGGIEYRKLDFYGNNYYTGGGYSNVYRYGVSGFNDLDGDGYTDYQLIRQNPGADVPTTSIGDLWTYYLQDTWRPLPNLTVKPGVRLDTTEYTNERGATIADFSELQPRLGVAWDFLGNGKSVLRANWGRFMHPGSVNLADTVNGRESYGGSRTYTGYENYCREYFPPGSNFCNREWLASRALDGQEFVTVDANGNEHYWYLTSQSGIDPFETVDTLGVGTLEATYVETLSLGYEQQLWDETSLSIEYLDKDTKSLIEDVCNNNDWVWDSSVPPGDFDNPDTWTDAPGCGGYVLANPDGMKRTWKGFVTKFETRYKGLHILANYTYGESEGNSESDATYSYASALYDVFPLDYYNYYGRLGDDAKHRLKVNGYLLLPLDFTISFDASYESEQALDVIADCARTTAGGLADGGWDPDILAYCAHGVSGASTYGAYYLEPRGNRRAPDDFYQVDLGVTKAFRIGDFSIELIASIVNLLGDEIPTSWQTEMFLPLEDDDGNFLANNVYGAPLTWSQPRRYEIGFRFEF